MSEPNWEVVYEANGSFLAEMLRGLLEAQEIPVVLSQEGAGHVYGITLGTLGRVQILVPTKDLERAQRILLEYETSSIADSEASDAELLDNENPAGVDQSGGDETA
jgi:hypothetical protein